MRQTHATRTTPKTQQTRPPGDVPHDIGRLIAAIYDAPIWTDDDDRYHRMRALLPYVVGIREGGTDTAEARAWHYCDVITRHALVLATGSDDDRDTIIGPTSCEAAISLLCSANEAIKAVVRTVYDRVESATTQAQRGVWASHEAEIDALGRYSRVIARAIEVCEYAMTIDDCDRGEIMTRIGNLATLAIQTLLSATDKDADVVPTRDVITGLVHSACEARRVW